MLGPQKEVSKGKKVELGKMKEREHVLKVMLTEGAGVGNGSRTRDAGCGRRAKVRRLRRNEACYLCCVRARQWGQEATELAPVGTRGDRPLSEARAGLMKGIVWGIKKVIVRPSLLK